MGAVKEKERKGETHPKKKKKREEHGGAAGAFGH